MPAPDWQAQAACNRTTRHLFWPRDGEGAVPQERAERAIAICQQCPVLAECRQWAATPVRRGGGGYRQSGFVAGGVLWPMAGRQQKRTELAPTIPVDTGYEHGKRTMAWVMRCPCEPCEQCRERMREATRRWNTKKRERRRAEGRVA
jgi:Transcription factor WhiB